MQAQLKGLESQKRSSRIRQNVQVCKGVCNHQAPSPAWRPPSPGSVTAQCTPPSPQHRGQVLSAQNRHQHPALSGALRQGHAAALGRHDSKTAASATVKVRSGYGVGSQLHMFCRHAGRTLNRDCQAPRCSCELPHRLPTDPSHTSARRPAARSPPPARTRHAAVRCVRPAATAPPPPRTLPACPPGAARSAGWGRGYGAGGHMCTTALVCMRWRPVSCGWLKPLTPPVCDLFVICGAE